MRLITIKHLSFVAALLLCGNAHAQQVFYESFDGLIATEGGNDGYYDNEDAPDGEICEEDLTDASLLDNKTGWGEFVATAMGRQCVRISTKKKGGSITTPPIVLDGSDATLTFNAAGYSSDVTTLYVKVEDNAGQLSYEGKTDAEIAIKLPASTAGTTVLANQTYTLKLTGVASSVRLTFSTVSSKDNKQRAFLDEIKVVKSASTGINALSAPVVGKGGIFTLDGRQVKSSHPQPGVYISNGKKVVIR